MNQDNKERKSAGVSILWPDRGNKHFKEALAEGEAGIAYNNMSAVIRYSLVGPAPASFGLAISIPNSWRASQIASSWKKTTVVFAAHHGRKSGKIPDSWLEKLDPQIIVIGEAASRHLHYYTGYKKITQNHAGDITFDLQDNKVHIYVSNPNYSRDDLDDEGQNTFPGYVGSITVEAEYSLQATQ